MSNKNDKKSQLEIKLLFEIMLKRITNNYYFYPTAIQQIECTR